MIIKKIIYSTIILLAGISLLILQIMRNDEVNSTTGFASAIIGVSIVRIIQLFRISKNPQLLKKYEINQTEERNITITEKSGRFVLMLTIMVEFIAICFLLLFNKNQLATIISFIAGMQGLIYIIIYFYLSKKL